MTRAELLKLSKKIDDEITLFHYSRARALIDKCYLWAKDHGDTGLECYFSGQKAMIRQDFKQALNYYTLAIRENPDDYCSLNDKGICLGELGRYKQALEAFGRGIRIAPNHAPLYQNKGWLLTLQAKWNKALLCFSKAMELDRKRVEAVFSAGVCYQHLGNISRALSLYKKSLKMIRGKSFFIYRQIQKQYKECKKDRAQGTGIRVQ